MSKKYKFKDGVKVTFRSGNLTLITPDDTDSHNFNIHNPELIKRHYLTPIRTKLTPIQAAARLFNGEGVCSESGAYFSFINIVPSMQELRDEAWYLPEDEEE